MKWAVTTLSTKGQVVIPESIRKAMKLEKGDVFVIRIKGKALELRKLVPV